MALFLSEFYARTPRGDLATLIADLYLEPDGTTADPAAWSDWQRCVDQVLIPET